MSNLLIQFKESDKLETTLLSPIENISNDSLNGSACDVIKNILTNVLKIPMTILKTDKKIFNSSNNTDSVKCFAKNINDGDLYFFNDGILFLEKPVIFFPKNLIQSMKFGRHGIVGSRYVDLEIEVDDVLHTFSMIGKCEQEPLANYVKSAQLLKNQSSSSNLFQNKCSASKTEFNAEIDMSKNSDDSDSDDSNFDPDQDCHIELICEDEKMMDEYEELSRGSDSDDGIENETSNKMKSDQSYNDDGDEDKNIITID